MNRLFLALVLVALTGSFLNAETLAIRKAEALIERFVTTPQEMRDKAWEQSKGTWDSVELVSQQELPDG
jgi:hypothetical protein